MRVKPQSGTWFFVKQKKPDRAKTRASRKNQGASEFVQARDKNDPTEDESHIHARAHDVTTSASNTKSQTSSTKSSGPSVETEKLAVTIYLASRQFKSTIIQEFLQQRLCEILDPDIFDKAQSVIIEAKLRGEKGEWDLDRVHEWLNKQLSHDNRVLLTEIDNLIGKVLEASVGALVSYA